MCQTEECYYFMKVLSKEKMDILIHNHVHVYETGIDMLSETYSDKSDSRIGGSFLSALSWYGARFLGSPMPRIPQSEASRLLALHACISLVCRLDQVEVCPTPRP